MTDKPTPKEIENLFVEETGFDVDDFPAAIFDFARAVLAKWGQPAQAAEPVARLVIGKTKGGVSLTHMVVPAAYQLQEGTYALYTTPQPTQPVAREQLTEEQIQDLLLCGNPTDEEMRLIRIGWDAANGIKGGQHGTE